MPQSGLDELSGRILYGITPCPPLLFVLGYSVSLPVLTAGITGISFSLASINIRM